MSGVFSEQELLEREEKNVSEFVSAEKKIHKQIIASRIPTPVTSELLSTFATKLKQSQSNVNASTL